MRHEINRTLVSLYEAEQTRKDVSLRGVDAGALFTLIACLRDSAEGDAHKRWNQAIAQAAHYMARHKEG